MISFAQASVTICPLQIIRIVSLLFSGSQRNGYYLQSSGVQHYIIDQ